MAETLGYLIPSRNWMLNHSLKTRVISLWDCLSILDGFYGTPYDLDAAGDIQPFGTWDVEQHNQDNYPVNPSPRDVQQEGHLHAMLYGAMQTLHADRSTQEEALGLLWGFQMPSSFMEATVKVEQLRRLKTIFYMEVCVRWAMLVAVAMSLPQEKKRVTGIWQSHSPSIGADFRDSRKIRYPSR
jgi:hypothetical protein